MMFLPLAKVTPIMSLVSIIWAFTAVVLIFIILIQKGKGGGLSAAFGGAGGGGLLGTKTGDFLTWITISLVILFLLITLVMVKYFKPKATEGLEAGIAPVTAPIEVDVPKEEPGAVGIPASDIPVPAENIPVEDQEKSE